MEPLIQLLIYVVIFAIVAYGLKWIIDAYNLPKPIQWICGALLLIVLLLFLANRLQLIH